MKTIHQGLLILAALALTAEGSAAQPGGVHARAVAALPLARQALQENLTNYQTARFRGVHARIVRSVYATDDGAGGAH